MILYAAHFSSEPGEFFSNKRDAIAAGKFMGAGSYVVKYDIGKVTKEKICLLASGCGFAESQETIWEHK